MPLSRKRRLPKLQTQADYDAAVVNLVEALGGGLQAVPHILRIMHIAHGEAAPGSDDRELLAIVDEIGRDTKRAVPCLCQIVAFGPAGGVADMAQAILARIGKRGLPQMREYVRGHSGGKIGWVTAVIQRIEGG